MIETVVSEYSSVQEPPLRISALHVKVTLGVSSEPELQVRLGLQKVDDYRPGLGGMSR
jgi:hypothetical protein